jgi:Lrp/AsnC family leucine-responsive transcriptional regulator
MHVIEYDKERTGRIKLDAKDKQLLAHLALDARQSYSTLAKHVLLSPDAVKYRLERLRKRRVLLGARTLLNLAPLGYASYHLFLSVHPPQEHESKLVAFFDDPRINASLQYLGKWDYEISVRTKDAKELDAFRTMLSQSCNVHDERVIELLGTIKSTALPEKIFPGIRQPKKEHAPRNTVPADIDEVDVTLLHTIADEADLRIEEIAKRSGLSREQVTYRMRKLENAGIIVGYTPVINYALLGFSIHALLFTFQARNPERELALAEFLRQHPSVLWAVRTLGGWDLLIYVISRDTTDLYDTVIKLREEYSDLIKSYETLIAFREYKYTYLPKGALTISSGTP